MSSAGPAVIAGSIVAAGIVALALPVHASLGVTCGQLGAVSAIAAHEQRDTSSLGGTFDDAASAECRRNAVPRLILAAGIGGGGSLVGALLFPGAPAARRREDEGEMVPRDAHGYPHVWTWSATGYGCVTDGPGWPCEFIRSRGGS